MNGYYYFDIRCISQEAHVHGNHSLPRPLYTAFHFFIPRKYASTKNHEWSIWDSKYVGGTHYLHYNDNHKYFILLRRNAFNITTTNPHFLV